MNYLLLYINCFYLLACPEFNVVTAAYLDKINTCDYMSVLIDIRTFGDEAEWNDTDSLMMVWHEGSVLYKADLYERISSTEYSIVVDHESKSIEVSTWTNSENVVDRDQQISQFLNLVADQSKYECSSESNFIKYHFTQLPEPKLLSADFVFRSDDHLLHKVVQQYDPAKSHVNTIQLRFLNYDFTSYKEKNRFLLNHYYSEDDLQRGISSKAGYKNYKITYNELK